MKEKELNEKDYMEIQKAVKNAKNIQAQQEKEEKALKTNKLVCDICGRTFYDYKCCNGRSTLPLHSHYKKCCPICEEVIVIPLRAKIYEMQEYARMNRIPIAYKQILEHRQMVEIDNLLYKEIAKFKAKK